MCGGGGEQTQHREPTASMSVNSIHWCWLMKLDKFPLLRFQKLCCQPCSVNHSRKSALFALPDGSRLSSVLTVWYGMVSIYFDHGVGRNVGKELGGPPFLEVLTIHFVVIVACPFLPNEDQLAVGHPPSGTIGMKNDQPFSFPLRSLGCTRWTSSYGSWFAKSSYQALLTVW